jgi:hypothetical protein
MSAKTNGESEAIRASLQEDELLYHYTSIESFLGMTESGSMWASHIRYLNDTSEQRLMWELVQTRINERLTVAQGVMRDKLLGWKTVAASPRDEDIYVISFSEDGGDRLSQWRGYGGSAGVSIGFRKEQLTRLCNQFTTKSFKPPLKTGAALLNEIQYVKEPGTEQSNRIIDIFLDRPQLDLPASKYTREQSFSRGISFFAANLKHEAFSEEREWRIKIFDFEGGPSPEYRARKGMLVPYLQFDIRNATPSKIIVGPSPHTESTAASIRQMVASKIPKETEIISTQIPYRDW